MQVWKSRSHVSLQARNCGSMAELAEEEGKCIPNEYHRFALTD